MKIYLANGLFSESDRNYNDYLVDKIEELGYEIYAPQRNLAINDKKKSAPSIPIYDGDTDRLKECDILIAILDGQDLGVASEIGWVAGYNEGVLLESQRKIILGLYTDNRDLSKTYSESKVKDGINEGIGESQFPYVNLYTVGAIKKFGKLFGSSEELLDVLKKLSEDD